MDESSLEEPIFEFCEVENDSTFENQECLSDENLVTNDEGSIFYVTVNQEDDELTDGIGTVDSILGNVYGSNLQISQSSSETLKLLTLENGQMYLTPSSLGETQNLTLVEPQLPDLPKDTMSLIADGDINLAASAENDLKVEPESNFHEIQLGDGTCALITTSLWNSMIENNLDDPLFLDQSSTFEKRRRFPCANSDCGKSFTTAHHLQVHMRIHTGVRPYACTVDSCNKRFATGYSLKAHLRTHTGEKPYGCAVCEKHFKTSGDLQKHMRTHTGEKPFKCPIIGCGKYFTTSNIRKVHVRSHTGERPYACNVDNCGKCFASATNYKNHMRIHSGEKPYQCSVEGCGKRFTEYSSLYKHNAVHQPYKIVECEYCDQMFKSENTLKLHKKSVHNVIIADDGTEFFITNEENDD